MRIREGLVGLLQVHNGNSLGLEVGKEIDLSSEQEEKFADYLRELAVTRADMSGSEIEDAALYFVLTHVNLASVTPLLPLTSINPSSITNDGGMGGVRADLQRVREGLDRVGAIIDRVGGGIDKVKGEVGGVGSKVTEGLKGGIQLIKDLLQDTNEGIEQIGAIAIGIGDKIEGINTTIKEVVKDVSNSVGSATASTNKVLALVGAEVIEKLDGVGVEVKQAVEVTGDKVIKIIEGSNSNVNIIATAYVNSLERIEQGLLCIRGGIREVTKELEPLGIVGEIKELLVGILTERKNKKWYEGGVVRNLLLVLILLVLCVVGARGQSTNNSVLMQGYNAGVLIPSASRSVGPFRINCDGTSTSCTWVNTTGTLTIAGIGIPSGFITLVISGSCPAGYSEVTALSGKTLIGTTAANGDVGTTGGLDSITPAGTNSAPSLTMNAYTPVGTNSAVNFTPVGTNATSTVTPLGSVAAPVVSWPAGVPTLSGSTAGEATHTHAFGTIAVASHTVVATKQGSSTGNVVTTATHTVSGSTAVGASHLHAVGTLANAWPAGVPTNTVPAFTGSSSTVAAQIFTGTQGSVSAQPFTGTQATLTGSVAAPGFTGTQFDNRSAFLKVIFCMKN